MIKDEYKIPHNFTNGTNHKKIETFQFQKEANTRPKSVNKSSKDLIESINWVMNYLQKSEILENPQKRFS